MESSSPISNGDRSHARRLALALTVVLALLAGAVQTLANPEGEDEGTATEGPNRASKEGLSTPATPSSALGGQRAYINPFTGELVPKPSSQLPSDLVLSRAMLDSLSRSHEGLIEEAHPRGGVILSLRGRFRSATFATIGPEGKVSYHHSFPTQRVPDSTTQKREAGGSDDH